MIHISLMLTVLSHSEQETHYCDITAVKFTDLLLNSLRDWRGQRSVAAGGRKFNSPVSQDSPCATESQYTRLPGALTDLMQTQRYSAAWGETHEKEGCTGEIER